MLKSIVNSPVRSGNQTILSGNLVIGTAGNGIDFSSNPNAPGATSELLSDYEEGTFTPSLQRSGSAPTVTYTSQKGWYVKVGSVVHCDIELTWTANSGGTGFFTVSGFPFAAKNTSGYIPQATICDASNFTYPAGTSQLGLTLAANQTTGTFVASGSAVTSNVVSAVGATGGAYISITYSV